MTAEKALLYSQDGGSWGHRGLSQPPVSLLMKGW